MRAQPLSTALGGVGLILASAGVATFYAIRPPLGSSDTLSVVRYIYDSVEPLWTVVFGAVTVLLLVTTFAGRWARVGYSVATGAFLAYSAALWLGAFSASPPSSWVSASFALALALNAFALTRSHARNAAWMPR